MRKLIKVLNLIWLLIVGCLSVELMQEIIKGEKNENRTNQT